MSRRGMALLTEISIAAVLGAALIGVLSFRLRLDPLAADQERRLAELNAVENLLQRARAGQDPTAPDGWRWEQQRLADDVELVTLIAPDHRRFETVRRLP